MSKFRSAVKHILPPSLHGVASRLRQYGARLILDVNPGVWSSKAKTPVGYRTDYRVGEISRKYVLQGSGRFLDVGGGDGKLTYLLGATGHTFHDAELYRRSRAKFRYEYFSVDLNPQGDNVLYGDICDSRFLNRWADHVDSFDVVYSNNVFEHLAAPWIAVSNLYKLMKPGGLCITIVPFSVRYHESPEDYFRYTHTAIPHLFNQVGKIEVLESGYDISARRQDEQGTGEYNDTCPVDRFGAWRETWTTVSVVRRLG